MHLPSGEFLQILEERRGTGLPGMNIGNIQGAPLSVRLSAERGPPPAPPQPPQRPPNSPPCFHPHPTHCSREPSETQFSPIPPTFNSPPPSLPSPADQSLRSHPDLLLLQGLSPCCSLCLEPSSREPQAAFSTSAVSVQMAP